MPAKPAPATQQPRPDVSERVRLRAGDVETFAHVTFADDTGVNLATSEPSSGPAQLVFSHPRGVFCLEGELSRHGDGVRLTIETQVRLDQRRNAFRLEIRNPIVIVRRDGQQLECRTADLSLTGVRILGADQLIEGEAVDLSLQIEGIGLEVSATVVRQGLDGCAVTFGELDQRVEHRLGTWLAEAQRAALLAA